MSFPRPLLERLVVAKYLLQQGRATLASGAPFASGLAVSQLQDGTELLLRLLAEHLHAQIKDRMAFDQLINAVDQSAAQPLTHRSALIQLNKLRINFKHHGLDPRREDAEKLLHDVESFFPETISTNLGINYDNISLLALVEHERTENWLRKSADKITAGDYDEAIDCAAIALAIFRYYLDMRKRRINLDRYGKFRGSEIHDLVEETEREFQLIHSRLDLILSGIHLPNFRTFLRFERNVTFTMSGTVHLGGWRGDAPTPTKEQAQACCDFAVDAILALKRSHIPGRWSRPKPEPQKRLEVLQDASIIVHPGSDPEVIRTTKRGEQLWCSGPAKGKYIPVIQDDDIAYIEKASVRELNDDEIGRDD